MRLKKDGWLRNCIKAVIKSGESEARSLERVSQLDSCLEEIKSLYTEALLYFGGTCRKCITSEAVPVAKRSGIDNTSIAIACGSGRMAQVSPAKKIEGTPAIAQEVRVHKLHRQKQAQLAEEVKLKALGKEMQSYLEALKSERGPRYVWSVKKLYHLLCQYKAEDILLSVSRASAHRLFDVRRIETILLQEIAQRDYFLPLSFDPEDYEHLPEYQQGAITPQPDIESYPREENPDDPALPIKNSF